jgi:predicted dehydrogenase
MKALVVGLGSMGKRRIRCLKALHVENIVGVELNIIRAKEVELEYSIPTYQTIDSALIDHKFDFAIISVPPKQHTDVMLVCCKLKIPFFVEASVVEGELNKVLLEIEKSNLIAAPSCTMFFHPAIKEISSIIKSNALGKISNVILHTGQYLPDWHTYEKVSDYYVSDPETGGAREIVPFELTWITQLLGYPRRVAANFRKTINIEGAEYIDDTYNCLMDFGSFLASITIDVVSRYATRTLLINCSHGQIKWSWDANSIMIYDSRSSKWNEVKYQMSNSHSGYNEHIGENMYIDEINAFLEALKGGVNFPNTLKMDLRVLKLLGDIESSEKLSRFIEFK